jgi:hypothetical protein
MSEGYPSLRILHPPYPTEGGSAPGQSNNYEARIMKYEVRKQIAAISESHLMQRRSYFIIHISYFP